MTAALAWAAYDEQLAVLDTWANQMVGCPSPAVQNGSCGRACVEARIYSPRIATNATLETLALTGRRSPHECVVVFRGSKNAVNALLDVYIVLASLDGCDRGCRVHSGFLHAWWSLQASVRAQLAELGCTNSTLSIAGHSLGGAVALLAAWDLSNVWRIGRLYTYGQPRVGNAAFAKAVDARLGSHGIVHYRVVDYKDAVPHLPWHHAFWQGWTHNGQEVYYSATRLGAYTTCTRANDTRCSYRWPLLECLAHTCDHCSYLGMNPCDCNVLQPHCKEPRTSTYPLVRSDLLSGSSQIVPHSSTNRDTTMHSST